MDILRKCAGCGKIKPSDELIKITKKHDTKELFINPSSKIFGRSVYICKNKDCIKSALKKNKIFKFLKTPFNENLNEVLIRSLDKQ